MSDNINITKEGIEVKPWQTWRALDYRQPNRKCLVITVADGKARMTDTGGHVTTVSVRRMHKHSTGWALVSDGELPK